MQIDVITIFPEYLAPLDLSLVGKARRAGVLDVSVHDLRSWARDRHRTVDDAPYGGGPGMVMRADVWGAALDDVIDDAAPALVIPTPSGRRFDQSAAAELAARDRLVFACGRYEGIDSRVAEHYSTRLQVLEYSVGDVVLAGGEVAVLLMVEALARLLPGVLGNEASAADDSFAPDRSGAVLEGPVYTRPPVWRGLEVPAVLRSGDHGAVDRWRAEESIARTRVMRPELLGGPGRGPQSPTAPDVTD
ncbi:MAG: tRNA (guanosine(37)-N1)-methyltransferase TrmD [Candidatus Nanopelagicales bacterium]